MVRQQLAQWIGVELWHLPEWYSRKEIAERIGASKSPTLLNALSEAVENGVLQTFKTLDDHNRPVIKYKITDDYRERQLEEAKEYGSR